ncbi:hypothetical protein EV363DRAFT_1164877 [Boletus edulis]|nr:hypothetical protein EV363DRAFT_1164877 [Boletus edulis]
MTSSSTLPSESSGPKANRFGNPLPIPKPSQHIANPRPYKPDLTPAPSPLHPHCLARQRLILWLPSLTSPRASKNQTNIVTDQDYDRTVLTVIGASWAESTKELYSNGLLVYHVYCDVNSIPDQHRAPITPNLLATFLANCAGGQSGSTVANYTATIRAWYILHGLEWNIDETEYKVLLRGVSKLAPPSAARPKHAPFSVEILEKFCLSLDITKPQDTAIFACLTCTFFCVARLGKLTVPAINKYDPATYISRSCFSISNNHEGLPVMKFHLPHTKTSFHREDAHCAPHDSSSITDPKAAIENHFRINSVKPTDHLFTWRHPTKGLCPLSKKEITSCIEEVKKRNPDMPDLKGHSLRIGGTLYYLLKGVPFDVVKTTVGRWSSKAFTIYLRHHALILASFLQHDPILFNNLCKYILPLVR